jgi:hypothetical protein
MMKRKLILAALALVITSGLASAFPIEQSDVIAVASLAQWAGRSGSIMRDSHVAASRLEVDPR